MTEEINFKEIKRWSFSYLDKHYTSGIYVMEFPNGMRYLGKSKNIPRRIREHFRDFSYASDWHSAARLVFTKLILPEFRLPEKHADWKIMTKQRYLILDQEIKEYQNDFNKLRYQMVCDFFRNVKLWIWEVPIDQITEAEDWCLNEITALDKREKYYNTAYPKSKEE